MSVKIALDSGNFNDRCKKIRPHMPNTEEVLNQILMEFIRDRKKELMISKIDLDNPSKLASPKAQRSKPE